MSTTWARRLSGRWHAVLRAEADERVEVVAACGRRFEATSVEGGGLSTLDDPGMACYACLTLYGMRGLPLGGDDLPDHAGPLWDDLAAYLQAQGPVAEDGWQHVAGCDGAEHVGRMCGDHLRRTAGREIRHRPAADCDCLSCAPLDPA